ncbi:MAG: CorA family divalent cation transporter, partial [Caldimonas sp.]
MPLPVRSFHIVGDQFTELETLPETVPPLGYLWIATTRTALEAALSDVQAKLQAWSGAQLFELHVLDLLNKQSPSTYDYTSAYDILVFRRLAAGAVTAIDDDGPPSKGRQAAIAMIDTSPVGFVVFDRVLLTVHPTDCQVREFFANRLQNQTSSTAEGRASARMPTSPPDLMLRMVNFMVDSYLELRRLLTKQLGELQEQLFGVRGPRTGWRLLLDSRNALNVLEDTCEDQRAAIVEWLDALEEWPAPADEAQRREREQLRVRSRDV